MSSSKNSSSKAGSSSSQVSPEVAAEIARLMRDPNALRDERSRDVDAEIARLMSDPDALRHERDGMQRGGRGHYDPNQPRVPAGDPKGGQFASKGYRGGDSGGDAGSMPASSGGTQLAELGSSSPNPRDAYAQVQPFNGEFGHISAGQHLNSQNGFIRTNRDLRRNRRMQDFQSPNGRFKFVSSGPAAEERIPGGFRWVISSTTYVYDEATGAYATISATPARPMMITSSYDKLFVRPLNR